MTSDLPDCPSPFPLQAQRSGAATFVNERQVSEIEKRFGPAAYARRETPAAVHGDRAASTPRATIRGGTAQESGVVRMMPGDRPPAWNRLCLSVDYSLVHLTALSRPCFCRNLDYYPSNRTGKYFEPYALIPPYIVVIIEIQRDI